MTNQNKTWDGTMGAALVDYVAHALLEDGAEVEVSATEDETSVRGNALASGNDEVDRAAEDAILARLESGDTWAWASVKVSVSFGGFSADAYLGGVSLASGEGSEQFDDGGSMESEGQELRMEAAREVAERLIDCGMYGAPGEVSGGTLQSVALVEALTDALDTIRESRAYPPSDYAMEPSHVSEVGSVDNLLGQIEGEQRAAGDSWGESEMASDAITSLVDALSAWALPGFYFGAHPGDGASFGFWPNS